VSVLLRACESPIRKVAVQEDDNRDIEASLAGDGEAYARLVRRYERPVASQMWRFCRDRAQCEQLVQDVFVEAWQSLSGYRGDAPFLHWLRRIATRVGYRFWKQSDKQAEHQPLQPFDASEPAGEELEASEAAALLHALLAKLPASDRLVLTLMYFEDCGTEEIADRTGWTRPMVKMRAYRARRKLKKMIEAGNLLEALGWTP